MLFYSNSYLVVDENRVETNIKIVDDTNLPGKTLAMRRLQLKNREVPLYPIRVAIYFLGDFIRLSKKGYWFIDSNGKIFTYQKSQRAKLKTVKITKYIPSKTTGTILELQGYAERFKTLFKVPTTNRYAQILIYKGLTILYGTSEEYVPDTWRLI